MIASKFADSPPLASGPSTNEQAIFTTPSQKPMAQSSNLPNPSPNSSSPCPYPNLEVDPMDEFSQTRAPDDLFDDDFTPVSEPVPPPQAPAGPKGRGGSASRGPGERGSRGSRGARRGAVPEEGQQKPVDNEQQAVTAREGPREQAVRGDRSGTGGVKQPKLTEDELSERLEKVKINNAAREAAHKRAQADEESFQKREQVAQAKRRQELQNRQVLEGERERNRLRKLKAVQGREWDAEKKEEDYNSSRGGRSSQFTRGAHGGTTYSNNGYNARGGAALDESSEFPTSRGRGRGRGDGFRSRGRGRGSGSGRGRGGHYSGTNDQPRTGETLQNPDFSAEKEFPALPGNQDGRGGNVGNKTGSQRDTGNGDQHQGSSTSHKTALELAPDAETQHVGLKHGDMGQASGEKDAGWADQMITPVIPSRGW